MRSIHALSAVKFKAASVQGLGYALHEEVSIGPDGRVCPISFSRASTCSARARRPACRDQPKRGAPSTGPLGTKGAGEVPILNVGATIACAVANATGKRVQELPLTPPRVLELLLDREPELNFPHIRDGWADNLVRPHNSTERS